MPTAPTRYTPGDAEVSALIRAAGDHPLGLEYLVRGQLGSVAITFGCHAFTVVAARDWLARSPSLQKES